jgi:hypothetical protein
MITKIYKFMKQVLRRTPNQVFHDELSPKSFYLMKESGKDYFLAESSEGTWEWRDFGSRENAGGTSFDSFEDAIEYATEPSSTEREIQMFESRRGLLTALYKATEARFQTVSFS